MKKIHIVLLVLLAVSIGVIMSTVAESSTYANFTEASENIGKEFHIVGKLDKSKPQIYRPEVNANLFSFYLTDNKGQTVQVNYKGSKPQDFEKSEQIVIVGKMDTPGHFECSSVLLKCPSKYNNPQDIKNSMRS